MESSRRRGRIVAPVALVGSALATTLAVATDGLVSNGLHIALVVVACAGYAAMLIAEQRWGGLGIRLVATVTMVSVVLATVIIPRFTGDLWSYAMYGRMLGIHHVSPWTHGPAAFPLDPVFHLVGRSWRHTPSVYGPAFTALSAGGAQIVGSAALGNPALLPGARRARGARRRLAHLAPHPFGGGGRVSDCPPAHPHVPRERRAQRHPRRRRPAPRRRVRRPGPSASRRGDRGPRRAGEGHRRGRHRRAVRDDGRHAANGAPRTAC